MPLLDLSLQALQAMLHQLALFLPRLLAALVLLVLGLVLARLLRASIDRLFRAIRFQRWIDRTGIEAFLRQGEIHLSLASLVSVVAYWLAILLTLVLAANVLQLSMVAEIFNRAILYVPRIATAMLLLVAGILAARLVNRLVFGFLNGLRYKGALALSTLAELAITTFVVFLALEQLLISKLVLHAAFLIGFGAIGLALAIAFGLGSREYVAHYLSQQRRKKP